jgi:hypothetical protein
VQVVALRINRKLARTIANIKPDQFITVQGGKGIVSTNRICQDAAATFPGAGRTNKTMNEMDRT